jgi:hypothetical protein
MYAYQWNDFLPMKTVKRNSLACLLLSLATFLLASGCSDKNVSKISELEKRIEALESSTKNTSNWVLWQTVEWADKTKFNNFGWPKVMSSFNTKEECLKSASEWTTQNGRNISRDPWIVTDGVYVITFSCLPPSINLRNKG